MQEDDTSRPGTPPTNIFSPGQVEADSAQVKRIIMEHMINNPPARVNTPFTPPDTPDRGTNPERDNYNVDKITDCWVCHVAFDSRKSLLRHLKEHNIDLPFKCYLCDASFNARLDCLQHKQEQHANDWAVLQEKNHVDALEHFVHVMNAIVNQNLGANADATLEDYEVGQPVSEIFPSPQEEMQVMSHMKSFDFCQYIVMRNTGQSLMYNKGFASMLTRCRFTVLVNKGSEG